MRTLTSIKTFVFSISLILSTTVFAGAGFGSGTSPVKNGSFGVDRFSQGIEKMEQVPRLPIDGRLLQNNSQWPSSLEKSVIDRLKNGFQREGLPTGRVGSVTTPDAKVLFIQKQHSDLVYDLAVPGEKEVIRLNHRPEEFTGLEGQQVLEALKKSSATKQWIQLQEVNQLNLQRGN
jgi:hypothetical protein